MKIGIMQGRLVPPEGGRFQSFPRSGWRREIEFAAVAGLDCIEWIDDQFGIGENPLWSSSGLAELRALSTRHGVAVRSVCADWFMENPLLRCGEIERRTGVARLCQLIAIGGEFGIARIVIPFVDNSRIEGDDDVQAVVRTLLEVEPAARTSGVELHLETALAPRPFAALLDRLPPTTFRVNYDSGNSSSLGYSPTEEFAAYGPRVGSVHIKDRLRGGGTVALGTGDADFPALFRALAAHQYRGDFILQAARGQAGDEVELARRNRAFVERAAEAAR
jgi:L-ribulose-5-phosphate 3-epimerase